MSSLIVEIVRIDDITAHQNADRLDIATVKGWQCVVGRGQYQPGELAIYIPIDSVIGEPTLSVLFPPDSKIKPTNGRIKTVKLRGVISQGMVAPVSVLRGLMPYRLGQDVAAELNITKYEPVEKNPVLSVKKVTRTNPNPHFHKYTHIENFRNFNKMFQEGDQVVITEKIHGTNFRAGWVPSIANTYWKKIKKFFNLLPKYEFVFGSHNVQLGDIKNYKGAYSDSCGNIYADAVFKYDLKNKLKEGEVVYGEIYGVGIQKGYLYGCHDQERKLVVFDLMRDGKYMNTSDLHDWCDETLLPTVPVLYEGPFSLQIAEGLTKGNSIMEPTQKVIEGVVIKPITEMVTPNGRQVLKLISSEYLLGKNSDFH